MRVSEHVALLEMRVAAVEAEAAEDAERIDHARFMAAGWRRLAVKSRESRSGWRRITALYEAEVDKLRARIAELEGTK